jgi:hypothetical protein
MNWQPIETAPRDAPRHSITVLVYSPEYGVRRGHYSRFYADRGEWPWSADDLSILSSKGLTHWMPLPEPPKE